MTPLCGLGSACSCARLAVAAALRLDSTGAARDGWRPRARGAHRLDARLAQVGVARGVQQALLGHDQGALAVAVDGAALQAEAWDLEHGHAHMLQDLAPRRVVLGPVRHLRAGACSAGSCAPLPAGTAAASCKEGVTSTHRRVCTSTGQVLGAPCSAERAVAAPNAAG